MNHPSAAVFLALLFATAILAAPSAHIANSIHHPNIMEDWLSITKCIKELVEPEVVPELKLQWQCTSFGIDKLIPQWETCVHESDSLMKEICKAKVIMESDRIFKEFESALEQIAGKEKITEINGRIKTKCFA